MLKGQLSIGFMSRTAVGFILVIALTYAVISMNDTFKKREQEQTIVSAAKYVANEVLVAMEELDENTTMNKSIRLPIFRDPNTASYAVSFEDYDGEIYVKATSFQWELVSRRPIYLNSSQAQINSLPSYPPKMNIMIKRENDVYQLNVTR